MTSPRCDIAGAGAARVVHTPTLGGTRQLSCGPLHGEVQHTPSAQNRPPVQSAVLVHIPPTPPGALVGVAVAVRVTVAVCVPVGVAVGAIAPERTCAMAKSSTELTTTRSNAVVLEAANSKAPPLPSTSRMT